jgi:hypothetical protein
MNSGETLIILLLSVIAYFLYHIAKQLSYLTGKRLKFTFFNWQGSKSFPKRRVKEKSEPEPQLSN